MRKRMANRVPKEKYKYATKKKKRSETQKQ